MTHHRALVLLTVALVRRLLREGLVLRSLVWPAALTVGTLLLTLLVAGVVRLSTDVAVGPGVSAELVEGLGAAGWTPVPAADPAAMVRAGDAWAGTDGTTIWYASGGPDVLRLEALLRADTPWRPEAELRLPEIEQARPQGLLFSRMLGALYTLYGVVFGLGMVARDRDDGSLEAELSLPLPQWIPGAARWIAGTAVLALFFALCVVLFQAIVGVDEAWAVVRHGFAACGGATAIGLASVGTAGIRQGFSGPLAAGLTAATGAVSLGLAAPEIGVWLPLASLFAGGDGWGPVALALLAGGAASAAFSWRSART